MFFHWIKFGFFFIYLYNFYKFWIKFFIVNYSNLVFLYLNKFGFLLKLIVDNIIIIIFKNNKLVFNLYNFSNAISYIFDFSKFKSFINIIITLNIIIQSNITIQNKINNNINILLKDLYMIIFAITWNFYISNWNLWRKINKINP